MEIFSFDLGLFKLFAMNSAEKLFAVAECTNGILIKITELTIFARKTTDNDIVAREIPPKMYLGGLLGPRLYSIV